MMASLRVELNRTGRKIELPNKENAVDAFDIIKENGYKQVNVLDMENWKDIQWDGNEFVRLFIRDGELYRFNEWLGKFPYKAVEIEAIGRVMCSRDEDCEIRKN